MSSFYHQHISTTLNPQRHARKPETTPAQSPVLLTYLYKEVDSARLERATVGGSLRAHNAAVDALRPTLMETFYPTRPTVYDEEEAEEAAGMAFAASVMGALGLGDSLEVAIALEAADATAW